jgi:hypothetical protein
VLVVVVVAVVIVIVIVIVVVGAVTIVSELTCNMRICSTSHLARRLGISWC